MSGTGTALEAGGGSVLSLLEAANPKSTAVVRPDGGVTFGRVRDEATSFAAALRARGIRPGDRVAIAEPEGPAFLRALLGVLAAGAAAAPLNPAYTEEEFRFYLDDLAPSLLLLPGEGIAAASAAAAGVGVEVTAISDLEAAAGGARPDLETPDPHGIALLLHTSGTTSRPKQVPLQHRNLATSARTIAAFYGLGPDDVSYCAMPLFHVHGLVASVLGALAGGGSVVVPRRFTPAGLLDDLGRCGVSWVSAGPTTYSMILERAERSGAGVDAPRLRFLRSCSSALPAPLMERVEARFAVPLVEAYGMTEASHQMASNPLPPGERKPGSVGLSAGAELRIRSSDGAFLDSGAQGEVCVRGPGITPGYLGNPEANAESFVDGWFRTGDLGTIDSDGYLRLEGRIKEMVIRGGENISPYEIEAVLLAHPAVREAACFGVPDEKYGEEVAAVVALERPAEVDELLAHCRERLAAFKAPKRLYVADAIPKTATGKVQRQRLPDLLGL